MLISVLLCTHNPRLDYLLRTVEGLRTQTLAKSEWELIVVDNASTSPVATHLELAWQPSARIVLESNLGLTSARLCAISEAKAPLLVFVDDDNVLAPDYLAEAARLADSWPQLGAFGCSIRPIYRVPPEGEVREWVWLLTVGEFKHERWSNLGLACPATHSLPNGAGLIVRANVAQAYAELTRTDPLRISLGRRGANLTGSDDRDLSATCGRLGLGTGKFPSLKLDHLISAGRLEPDYLERLAEATAYGETILAYLHGLQWKPIPQSRTRRWLAAWERWHLPPLTRCFCDAEARGRARAVELLANLPEKPATSSIGSA